MVTAVEQHEIAFTSGEALEAYRRVKLSSDGASVTYAGAWDVGIGTTKRQVANASSVNVKLWSLPGKRIMIASEAIAAGSAVYGAASGKVTDNFASGGPQIGIALTAATADGDEILVLLEKGGEELLFAAVAQSDAVGASSSAEHTFSTGAFTLPAGQVRKGDVFRMRAMGKIVAANSTDTFTARAEVGTETVATTPLPDATNGDVFIIDLELQVREVGASGKLVASGYVLNDALTAGLATPFAVSTEVTEDLSVALEFRITGQWSASAANEARLEQFSVSRLRK